jgi:hypothetical protein
MPRLRLECARGPRLSRRPVGESGLGCPSLRSKTPFLNCLVDRTRAARRGKGRDRRRISGASARRPSPPASTAAIRQLFVNMRPNRSPGRPLLTPILPRSGRSSEGAPRPRPRWRTTCLAMCHPFERSCDDGSHQRTIGAEPLTMRSTLLSQERPWPAATPSIATLPLDWSACRAWAAARRSYMPGVKPDGTPS